MKRLLLIIAVILTVTICYSQNLKIIEIDPITDMAKESLPIDQGFVLKKVFNDPIEIIGIGYYEIKQKEIKSYFDFARITNLNLKYKIVQNDKKYELYIFVPPLKPQKFYDFLVVQKIQKQDKLIDYYLRLFNYINLNNQKEALNILNDINIIKKINLDPFEHYNLNSKKPDIDSLLIFYQNNLRNIYNATNFSDSLRKEKIIQEIITSDKFVKGKWLSTTSEIFSFDTRAKFGITPDFGYIYYGFQEYFYGLTPYLGFQVDFRYIDKNVPLKLVPNKTIWHRLSLNSGITLASLKKDNRREDLFTGKSLLIGAGFRFSNALRLTGGAILFNSEDPNPLIDNKKMSITPFIGLSIDLSLKQLLNDVSALIPINRN